MCHQGLKLTVALAAALCLTPLEIDRAPNDFRVDHGHHPTCIQASNVTAC